MMNVIVKPNPPYDFYKMMHKLSLDPQYKVNRDQDELFFAMRIKVVKEEDLWEKGIVILTNQGTIEHPEIRIQFIGNELNEAEQAWLIKQLDFRFGWSTDVLPRFYQAVQDDPVLASLVQKHEGLPLVLEEGLYECLMKTIIHQQVNLRFAQQLVVDLGTEYGETIEHQGHTYAFFPTPSQLAKAEVEALRERKFSRRKAEYITDLARKIASGELDLDILSQENNDSIIKELTKERGVGLWTVECFLLFGLGRANLFPAGDLGIQKALQQALGLVKRPSPEECREWAKPYEDWGTYVALYLWESLR